MTNLSPKPNQSNEPVNTANAKSSNKKLIAKLVLLPPLMFCFAVFLMPPLYDVFCDITGLNGKYTDGRVALSNQGDLLNQKSHESQAENARTVTVQFVADATSDVNWPFFPKIRSIHVEPGTIHHVSFRVENPKSKPVVARAIPSISPGQASLYLKKTQCFCFNEQPLAAYEGKDMGLVFYIDPEIPADIKELTLSYRLYDITETAATSSTVSDAS